MSKKFILSCMAIGILAGGVCNNAFATNGTEQTAERQVRILTKKDANRLIEEMKARISTELVIPEEYTSIGDWAFCCCSSLTSITIPDSVTSIGSSAFYNCSSLTSITIPDGVTSIRKFAFYNCQQLKRLTLPDTLKKLGENVFGNCTSLSTIEFGSTLKSMGFTNKHIMTKYILFSLFATSIGAVSGSFLGVLIIPNVIFNI